MTKSHYVKYRCSHCSIPCNYFYELPYRGAAHHFTPPVACICGLPMTPDWKRVNRFTPNGI